MKNGAKKAIGGGILFFVAGIIPFAFVIPIFFHGERPVLRAPGTIEISIKKPGKYVVWNNYNTTFEGNTYFFGKELPGGLSFSLNEKFSGTTIPFQTSSGTTVTIGEEEKVSVGYFKVTNAGQYKLTITGDAGNRIFSFEKSMLENVGNFFLALIGGIVLAIILLVVAVVFIIQGIIELGRESKTSNEV
ncbi:MAG: hypothetical protein ACOYJW_00970 [Candidatus Omnitrophota bacterium]|jgi:hypothetical protein